MSVTDDAFLDGRLRILQPRQGYRAGLDAVMLAAAVEPPKAGAFSVLDVGAGVGTAGLCVAWRCPEARVVLLEREQELVALARENIARNALGERVSVVAVDVGNTSRAELSELDIAEGTFDRVIANPPFHAEGAGTAAANALKAAAHAMPETGLEVWCRFLARMARPGGEALVIHKTEAMPILMQSLEGRFGGLSALPLHSFAGDAASRVLLRGTKGSRAPFRLEAGIVLHQAEGGAMPGTEAVLRLGQSLAVAYGSYPTEDMAERM